MCSSAHIAAQASWIGSQRVATRSRLDATYQMFSERRTAFVQIPGNPWAFSRLAPKA